MPVAPTRPEIELPYAIVAQRYGSAVADLMGQLALSEATTAKSKSAAQFKWFLVYDQAEDPPTRNMEDFVRYLIANSDISLVVRGFKWRSEIKLETVPPQVLTRFEERARLICQAAERLKAEEDAAPTMGSADVTDDTLHDLRRQLDLWLATYPEVNPALASIAKLTINSLIQDVKESRDLA